MATTTRTLTPAYVKTSSNWAAAWSGYSDASEYPANSAYYSVFNPQTGPATISGLQVSAEVYAPYANTTFVAELFSGAPGDAEVIDSADYTYTFSTSSGWETATFSFQALDAEIPNLYIGIRSITSSGNGFVRKVRATATYEALPLVVSVTPASLNNSGNVTVRVQNWLHLDVGVQFKYGSTVLTSPQVVSSSPAYDYVDLLCSIPAACFADAGITANSMRIDLVVTDSAGRSNSSAHFTLTRDALEVELNASSVLAGDTITVSYNSDWAEVVLSYNTVQLARDSGSGSSKTFRCYESWLEDAGPTATSMQITVTVTDRTGRTATARFTMTQPQGSAATPTAPKNATVDGVQTVNFAWTVADTWGTQTAADLQWSRDNAVWTDLAHINGSAQTWTAPAVSFPAGQIYWRVRARNSYNVTGAWSSAVSFTVRYDAVSQAIPVNSQTSGLVNRAADLRFTVALQATGTVFEPFTIAAASFFWRAGESGDYTEAAMTPDGTTASVTITGGTFPAGTFQWYAQATDNTGRTTSTEVYTLRALSASVEAAPVRPINTVESGSGPIVFLWDYGSLDGSPQSAADLQYSQNGTVWTDLASVTGNVTTYTAAAGALPGGTLLWRVRAYNGAGTAGPWSDPVSFVSFAAPIVTSVSTDGLPFLTISWQVEGQSAWKIEVDGKLYGPYSGKDTRSFTLTEPLPDGLHSVKVSAQNRYSLWSVWAETTASVTNVPGPSITIYSIKDASVTIRPLFYRPAPTISQQPRDMQGTSGNAAFQVFAVSNTLTSLYYQWYYSDDGETWTAYGNAGRSNNRIVVAISEEIDGRKFRCRVYNEVGEVYSRAATFYYRSPSAALGPLITGEFRAETGFFLVYRDGKLVGKTYGDFVDRAAVGTHEYYLIQVLPGGFYTKSAVLTVSLHLDCPVIAPLEGGDFLPLKLSEEQNRAQKVAIAQEVAYIQYAGSEYPEEEISEHRTKAVTLDAAELMENEDFAKTLEALIGKRVIVKTPGDAVVVGVLAATDLTDRRFNKRWDFVVRQGNWRDFADES